MLDNFNEVVDEAKSALSIDDLDLDIIVESIEEQVEELMESSSKRNYLKAFEDNLDNSDLSDDERKTIRETMYDKIIDIISEKFNIHVDTDSDSSVSKKGLAKNLYKFFVINYVNNVEQFLESYIIENKKEIVAELERKDINAKRIEGISSKKIAHILNNTSFVIEIIASSNITFREFLEYIIKHPNASSASEELLDYMDGTIDYADDIVKFIMDQLINEEEGFGNIYTELQRNLFERFSSI